MKEEKDRKEEQEYLQSVRRFMEETGKDQGEELRILREKVDRLKKQSGGTYSQDYELALNSLQLMERRQGDFRDSREKPYFGRIDFRANLALEPDRLYIGKHAIRDNDSVFDWVTDWRAPVADLYYQGTLGRTEYRAPAGFIKGELSLKRRFAYTKDDLPMIRAVFDEGDQILVSGEDGEGMALQDEFLRLTLEEAAAEKLKEIVATIAREQNEIIRAEKNIPVIVQGAAGAGKTTVALHRLAYLLYYHRDTLKGSDVCIIAPNRLFLDYISEVLPDLGSGDVAQTTLEDLILKELKIRKYSWNKDEVLRSILEAPEEEAALNAALSKFKGSEAFIKILDAMILEEEKKRSSHGPVLVEEEILYGGEEITRLFTRDLTYLPLNARTREIEIYCTRNLKKRLEKVESALETRCSQKIQSIRQIWREDEAAMRERIIQCYDERDRVLKELPSCARKAVKAYFRSLQQPAAPEVYEKYLKDRAFLEAHPAIPAEGSLPKRLMAFRKDKIQADDLPALMYLSMKLEGVRHRWSHIVVDEAQDYTLLQLEVMRLMARQDSMTLVGDLAQGIYSYRAISAWKEAAGLFSGGVSEFRLRNSYRSTMEIIREANRTLERMKLDLKPAIPVLRHGREPVKKVWRSHEELTDILKEVEETMEKDRRSSLAIVTRTFQEAEKFHGRLKAQIPGLELIDEYKSHSSFLRVVIPSYLTKGLEFDCVVLADEGSYSSKPLDQRLKYVALTRALHLEYILTGASRERF